jgi:hypothetical protein
MDDQRTDRVSGGVFSPMKSGKSKAINILFTAIFILLALAVLAFAPMFVSKVEQHLLGTNYVQKICDQLGILDDLKSFYDWVFR